MCEYFRIHKINTVAYRPQTNGLTEKFNGTLCKMLASYCNENQTNWDIYLPIVLFAYRTSIQKTTKESPFRLLYGRDPRLPADVDKWSPNAYFLESIDQAWKEAKSNIEKAASYSEERQARKVAKEVNFGVGEPVRLYAPATKVGLKKKLRADLWKGPYKVTALGDKGNIQISENGKNKWVNRDQIKKIAEVRTRYGRISKPPDRFCSV